MLGGMFERRKGGEHIDPLASFPILFMRHLLGERKLRGGEALCVFKTKVFRSLAATDKRMKKKSDKYRKSI